MPSRVAPTLGAIWLGVFASSGKISLVSSWSSIDRLERELIAASLPAPKKPTGFRGLLARIRAYLPGAHKNEKWGEPSPHAYYHQVHICHIM